MGRCVVSDSGSGGSGEHYTDRGSGVREALAHVVGYIIGAARGAFPDDETGEGAARVIGLLFAGQPLGFGEDGVIGRAVGVVGATFFTKDEQVASRARLADDQLVEVLPAAGAVGDGIFEEPVFLIGEDDAAAGVKRAGGVDGEEVGAAGGGGDERGDVSASRERA